MSKQPTISGDDIICKVCKGVDVQITSWVNPNTRQVFEDASELQSQFDTWCVQCEQHGTLVMRCEDDDPNPTVVSPS